MQENKEMMEEQVLRFRAQEEKMALDCKMDLHYNKKR